MLNTTWLSKPLIVFAAIAVIMFFSVGTAHAVTCPSCNTLITINPDGSITITNPAGPAEDALVGVANNDPNLIVNSISLSGNGIFDFDGDGPFGGSYTPAGVSFTGIVGGSPETGTVVFSTGIANGQLGLFGLEEPFISVTAINAGDPYFTTYFSNANTANAPDATVRAINDGSSGGNLYASIYVFDDSEELTECCSCVITPDGLLSESVNKNLTAAPLTGIKPTRGVIKIISSSTEADVSSNFLPNTPTAGIHAWATHVQKLTSGYALSESPFSDSNLASSEQSLLEQLCSFDHQLSGKPCTCTPEDSDF
jgi:hypothetical protein